MLIKNLFKVISISCFVVYTSELLAMTQDEKTFEQMDSYAYNVAEKETLNVISESENTQSSSHSDSDSNSNNETNNNRRIDDLYKKVDSIERELQLLRVQLVTELTKLSSMLKPKVDGVNQSQTSNMEDDLISELDTNLSDVDAYKQAYKLILSKEYNSAVKALLAFLEKYPESEYLANCYYWLGELYLHAKDHKTANMHFDVVINKFPKSTKVASSMLKRAYGLIGLKKLADGKSQLLTIIQTYPNTTTAAIAKKKLATLQ